MANSIHKILLLGGAGYVGCRLAPFLKKEGYSVTVFDTCWFGNNLPNDIKVVKDDLMNMTVDFIKDFDCVVYLAGLSNDPMAEYSPQLDYIYNTAGVAYIALIAKQAKVKRFIFASSCSVYGFSEDALSTEKSITSAEFPYGISKILGEKAALFLADDDFSVICLRKGTISGYSPRQRFDLIINTLFMKACIDNAISIANPTIRRPILAMSDALNSYKSAIDTDLSITGIFNICSANFTLLEIGQSVVQYFKDKHNVQIQLNINNVSDNRNYHASNNKAKTILKTNFNGSIESILTELDEHFSKTSNFDDDNYYNINILKKIYDNRKNIFA